MPELYPKPTIVAGLTDVVEVAVGQIVSCALQRDGNVWCWGDVLGSRSPLPMSGLPLAERVFAGSGTICVITSEARVACTGVPFLTAGSCTMPSAKPELSVVDTPNIDHVVDIAIGQREACALRSDGSVWCWGCGDSGVLGSLQAGNHAEPIVVPNVRASLIAAETSAVCTSGPTGICWGDGSQFGVSLTIAPGPPRGVVAFDGAKDIDVGVVFACAALQDAVRCNGALYDFATCSDHRVDDRVFPIAGVREISVGYEDACARDASGGVWCWGCNLTGVAGDVAIKGQAEPVRVAL